MNIKKGKNIDCKNCKKEFYAKPGQIKRGKKYCSNKCQIDFQKKQIFLKAELQGKFKDGNHKICKKYLIEKYGHKCQICGITEWQGKKVPLIKDHINGIWHDNTITNLRLICRNCDGLLETYAGRNRNKTHIKYKYYNVPSKKNFY